MVVDAHQHFWKFDPVRDVWITDDMKTLRRDFFPEDLALVIEENEIDGCISVQADQSESETQLLLELAKQNHFIKGVVGWVDLSADNIAQRLDYFSSFKLLRGLRHIIQTEPKGFMTQEKFLSGVRRLETYHFTYDILIYHHQLAEAVEFVKNFPNQKFVVDHLAKPDIKGHEFDLWSKGMKQLASFENVSCKISGFTTEAKWHSWSADDFSPYFEFVLEHFGVSRLIYGSDWPVCLLSSSYKRQLNLVKEFISTLSVSEKQRIMGDNATDFYNL